MTSTRTPGEWSVITVSGAPLGVGVKDPDTGITKMVCNTLFDGDVEADMPRRLADAQLLAMAPEMLETLKGVIRRMHAHTQTDRERVYRNISATIVKAEKVTE